MPGSVSDTTDNGIWFEMAPTRKAPRSPLWLTNAGSGLLPQDTSSAKHTNVRCAFKPNDDLKNGPSS